MSPAEPKQRCIEAAARRTERALRRFLAEHRCCCVWTLTWLEDRDVADQCQHVHEFVAQVTQERGRQFAWTAVIESWEDGARLRVAAPFCPRHADLPRLWRHGTASAADKRQAGECAVAGARRVADDLGRVGDARAWAGNERVGSACRVLVAESAIRDD